MYYLVYGILYLLSLLPFFVLYFISDGIYLLFYHVIGYRKQVVMGNIAIAFPEKTPVQRTAIAKQFYKGFIDTLIETVKLLSLSDANFIKRCTGGFSVVNEIAKSGRNVQMLGGHQFNWEYVNLLFSREIQKPFVGVVANLENKTLNRIFFKFRARYGTILIPNSNFQREMVELMKKRYTLCLLADQNTSPERGYWLNFFNQPVPFIMGPHKAIKKFGPVVVYFNVKKLKRGYYHFEINEVLEDAGNYTAEELTMKYRDHLEMIIRSQPENYLWSHRRWKHTYNESYSKLWIDKTPAP